MITGDYGVGKTYLFEILHNIGREIMQKRNHGEMFFNCVSTPSLVSEYMRESKISDSTFNIKQYYSGNLYIDDLGYEEKAFNRIEILGEILFERYRNKALTLATTNLIPSELTMKYGERIGDRLPKMFNIIKWNGNSFRHQ
ncbi:hypothetical protein [Aquimarina hainanensis]|uniref:hypothetical protein n=1 Tax=Aquimarina hainanensis TaxID=1578017 RepID=UPI0036209210